MYGSTNCKTIESPHSQLNIIAQWNGWYVCISVWLFMCACRDSGFPGILGAIDCTHVPIKAPSRAEGENAYVDRHGIHSLNVQVITKPRKLYSFSLLLKSRISQLVQSVNHGTCWTQHVKFKFKRSSKSTWVIIIKKSQPFNPACTKTVIFLETDVITMSIDALAPSFARASAATVPTVYGIK